MHNDYLIPVDESIERAMREEALHGKCDLLGDLRGGIHARSVIAEMNHRNSLRHIRDQAMPDDDFEFRLEGILHGNGFHQIAMQEGTYDVWNTDQSDRLKWIQNRFPENKVKLRARNATILVGTKYGPPAL